MYNINIFVLDSLTTMLGDFLDIVVKHCSTNEENAHGPQLGQRYEPGVHVFTLTALSLKY